MCHPMVAYTTMGLGLRFKNKKEKGNRRMDWFSFAFYAIFVFMALAVLCLLFYLFWLLFGWFILVIALGGVVFSYFMTKDR